MFGNQRFLKVLSYCVIKMEGSIVMNSMYIPSCTVWINSTKARSKSTFREECVLYPGVKPKKIHIFHFLLKKKELYYLII